MRRLLIPGAFALMALAGMRLDAWAQAPYLTLAGANVDSAGSTVQLLVYNSLADPVTVSQYHVKVVKKKLVVTDLQTNFAEFVNGWKPDRVASNILFRPTQGNVVTSVTATSTNIKPLRFKPETATPPGSYLPIVLKDVTAESTNCYPCGPVLRSLTKIFTTSADEANLRNTVNRLLDRMHTHTEENQNVLTSLTPTTAKILTDLEVEREWMWVITDPLKVGLAVTDVLHTHDLIRYECSLVYDVEPTVVPPGSPPIQLSITLAQFTEGDTSCLPVAGERVVFSAYNDVGALVLNGLKTAQ